MNTRFTALALALTTLTLLGTGCDPETTASTASTASIPELRFRDGEIIDYPTTTTGGTIKVKGGHDNPFEILYMGFDRAPLAYQEAFLREVEKQLPALIVDALLSDESVVDQCISSCAHQEMQWEGGISIHELRFEHEKVRTVIGELEQLAWETEVRAEATGSCECSG